MKSLYSKAKEFFPGGVNSPARAFKSVGSTPLFIEKACGSRVFCSEGREYIDYVGSWGPMILGHAHKAVVEAVCKAAENGLSFGAPSRAENRLAELVKKAFSSIEKMRMVSSGTEATMSAIRLARGYTNRPLIIKADGAYHGHSDSLLVSAGSGVATLAIPECPGVPDSFAQCTLVVDYNDEEALEKCFNKHKDQVAAVIVEPVCGNMGVVTPKAGYLERIRDLCNQNGSVLIFDEVMTGFRACFGGASHIYEVKPDLTCLGKVVGGGMPLAIYGGSEKIMSHVAPDGPVYQAGTLSGNPLAATAGAETLQILCDKEDFYMKLDEKSSRLQRGLLAATEKIGMNCVVNRFGSMVTLFFNENEIISFKDAQNCDTKKFAKYFNLMLKEGIYLPPSQFEAMFVSQAHTEEDIDRTIAAAEKCLAEL